MNITSEFYQTLKEETIPILPKSFRKQRGRDTLPYRADITLRLSSIPVPWFSAHELDYRVFLCLFVCFLSFYCHTDNGNVLPCCEPLAQRTGRPIQGLVWMQTGVAIMKEL